MAKKKKVEIEEEKEELEELEDLEDLADEEDEEEDEDEEEGEDEDAPKAKKKKAKAKPKTSEGAITSADLAEALGTDGKNLRVMLRAHNAEKNENGRYEWPSLEAALEALGFEDEDEAKAALEEARDARLKKLKDDAETKRAAMKAEKDEDDDEDEEEEAPKPKKKKKKAKA